MKEVYRFPKNKKISTRYVGVGLLLFFSVWMSEASMAQLVIPSDLIPGRQKESQQPSLLPQSKPEKTETLLPMQLAPEQAAKISFNLSGVTIKGSTIFPVESFDDLWKPLVGHTINVARLYEMANTITARYAEKGYALSFAMVPEQKIEKGTIILTVIEGFVNKVAWTGDAPESLVDKGLQTNQSRKLLDQITHIILDSRPLRSADLERAMLLMNDLSGMTALATFSASPDTPQASLLTIELNHKPIEAQASSNNRMSKDISRWDVAGGVTYNGVWFLGDALSLDGHCSRSGCDDSHDASAEWSNAWTAQGLKTTIAYNHNQSRPKRGFLAPLEFEGLGSRLSASMDYPLVRSRQQSLWVGGGFDLSNAKTETLLGMITRDKTRQVDLRASYDFADGWSASNVVSLKLAQGLDLFDATKDDDILKSRQNGSSRFTNLLMNYVRVQPLYKAAMFLSSTSLYAEAKAQMALSHQLLSATQCSYGGAAMGRGYNSGIIGGDHCMIGLVELRQDEELYDIPVQAYGFVDAGRAWIKGDLIEGEPRSQSASSTGFGFRLGNTETASGDFQLAFPLRKDYSEDQKGKPRLFVTLRVKY